MGGDQQFFTDCFDGMRNDWTGAEQIIESGQSQRISRSYTVPKAGNYLLQYQLPNCFTCQCISHHVRPAKHLLDQLPHQELTLEAGTNLIQFNLTNTAPTPERLWFQTRLLDPDGFLIREQINNPLPQTNSPKQDTSTPDLTTYSPGAGKAFQSCGRFGFTKGDGLLDYSMPYFGRITRPFISGHPQYHQHKLWGFSLLPEGEELSGDLYQTYQPPQNETITADWSHVRWTRHLNDGHTLTFDYSIMAPSLLIETDQDCLRLSDLAASGGYHAITLPLASGCVTRDLSTQHAYEATQDGPLAQGWILLSRSGQFPEVPLLIMLARQPQRLELREDSRGHIAEIRLIFNQPLTWAMLAFPFGIKLFQPHELTDQWHAQAIQHCRDLHQQALARPIRCEEWFRCQDGERLDILQQFTYRTLEDAWDTPSIQVAPLPPPVILAAQQVPEIQLDERQQPLDLPTKYGPWHGVPNSSWSAYSLPVPDYRCHFPLSNQDANHLGDLIHQDFDQYLSYHLDAPEVGNPGNYSFVFQYAFTAKLFPILKPEDRHRLETIMAEGIKKVCNPDYQYIGPGKRHCLSWYQRTEPFTKLSWYSTYLHVSGIRGFKDCDRNTVEHAKTPFIEVDWGNAMSLYGTWMGALLSGQWDDIRQHWNVLRKAFDYYLHLMDWACMTAPYSENGVSWNDGTNYGGYLGFMNMAELTGHHEDFQLARYAYAKMTAMRMGLFSASQHYFYKYFDVSPWYCTKFFHEETDANRAFQSYPKDIVINNYRRETLYNLTTEGHYKEAWDMYAHYLKPEVLKVLELAEQASSCPMTAPPPKPVVYHTTSDVFGWQEVLTWLMLNLNTGRMTDSQLLQAIEDASQNSRIAREFLGDVILSKRRVPAQWAHVYLLTQLYGKDLPQLTAWMNLRLEHIDFPRLTITQVQPGAWIECFSPKQQPQLTLNGKTLKLRQVSSKRYRADIPEDGELRFL